MIFLYSSSPAPYEPIIMAAAPGERRIVMQTPLESPDPEELVMLRRHFPDTQDSGLAYREDAFDADVIERLRTADLILITGGSPERLVECTVDTPALAALREAEARGAVIAGCSAGAVAIGAGMPERRLWGWLPGTLIAPHFGGYDIGPWRQEFPDCRIVGIPDGAMAVVGPDRTPEPVGTSELTILPPYCSERK